MDFPIAVVYNSALAGRSGAVADRLQGAIVSRFVEPLDYPNPEVVLDRFDLDGQIEEWTFHRQFGQSGLRPM
jgi:hypothetical protein